MIEQIIKKLKNDITYPLTSKEFEALNLSFEDFLRYGQINEDRVIAFHKALIRKYAKA
tara:strand:+ start:820 stop:993 length:174 start_codon:yes stop_codon:yes gene_type:complete